MINRTLSVKSGKSVLAKSAKKNCQFELLGIKFKDLKENWKPSLVVHTVIPEPSAEDEERRTLWLWPASLNQRVYNTVVTGYSLPGPLEIHYLPICIPVRWDFSKARTQRDSADTALLWGHHANQCLHSISAEQLSPGLPTGPHCWEAVKKALLSIGSYRLSLLG